MAKLISTRRRNRQIERGLQAEIVMRLKMARIFHVPIPNGVYLPDLPATLLKYLSEQERHITIRIWNAMKARIINTMKAQGGMEPGAFDLVIWGSTGRAGLVELKREASTDLLGHKITPGQLNQDQRVFRDRAEEHHVPWAICRNWGEVLTFYRSLC